MNNSLKTKKSLLIKISFLLAIGLTSCANQTNQAQAVKETKNVEKISIKKASISYPIVDTNQGLCYDNSQEIEAPRVGESFYGQDAQYTSNVPSYTDNGNQTITDNVTGLIWSQELSEYPMTWEEAVAYVESLNTGGITTWRLPNIKELWSIRDFSQGWPWIDTNYFHLVGDGSQGAQQHSWSSNYYLVDTDLAKENVAFVVNDWTGHIKALDGKRYVRAVSGKEYGINDFKDNGDSTVSDLATGLMWAKDDSQEAMNWEEALAYAQTSEYAGYTDWRLPNAKELQSIVDYSGVYPAIDTSVFNISQIVNEAKNDDYPYFWTSTTNPYIDPNDEDGYWYAWYVAFGYAVDQNGEDIHGAGAIRFDTKAEDGADGPDGERYYNYVRLVRGGNVKETPHGDFSTIDIDRIVNFDKSETGDKGQMGTPPQGRSGTAPDGQQPPQMGAPNFAAAAIALNISEEDLIAAFPDPSQGPPNFEEIAKELGVSLEDLLAALAMDDQMTGPGPGPRN
ncbi:MAG: DUF1566 domain-containing protein [Sphaerochaetaceae bacterium]|nr:DUF1566 domain-containing protein [Sphaerochaetaceae bacterium]MDC7242868.1 DUF1566 domain-containing protein [Sphaerochaetaceae bacterium]